MKQQRKVIASVIGIVLLAFVGGCKKKAPVAATPPAPAPTEVAKPSPPTISVFSIEPNGIQQGQSAEMRWRVEDATDIEVNQGIGAVTPSGERQVDPSASTTYTLLAKGPGGTATANATLNVTSPPPVAAARTTPTIGERLSNEVEDAFFDFDRSNLRQDAQTALTKDADALKAIMSDFPNTTVVIEGHCDERGSAEYNLGLSQSVTGKNALSAPNRTKHAGRRTGASISCLERPSSRSLPVSLTRLVTDLALQRELERRTEVIQRHTG